MRLSLRRPAAGARASGRSSWRCLTHSLYHSARRYRIGIGITDEGFYLACATGVDPEFEYDAAVTAESNGWLFATDAKNLDALASRLAAKGRIRLRASPQG